MIDYLYLFLYKSFKLLLSILSHKSKIRLIKALARLAYKISSKHRKIIAKNLSIAFGDTLSMEQKKEIGLSAFMNLIDTTFGILQRDGISKSAVVQNIKFENSHIVQRYIDENKKIIFITGHQSNWELLSQSIAIHFGITLVGVGRKLDSEVMDRVLKENREQFNVEMVYKKGAMKGCIKSLSQNKAIGILIDQAISKEQSIDIKFFAQDATHTPIASILSRKFDIDLIPAFISTDDYINYTVKIYEPIESIKTTNKENDLYNLTQAQANAMERAIRAHPKEWFWMHKRWKGFEGY
ncbi:MAG: lipid A biosynthesis lauroyl acyltransferase [Sulfurovum sp.]